LASKGCNLILNFAQSSSEPLAIELARTLAEKHDIRAFPVQVDLGQAGSGEKLVESAKNHLGGEERFQIDIIINNAGVGGIRSLADVDTAHFEQYYRINVLGPILVVQAALPYLPHDRSGRIVNVSSVSSSIGTMGQTVYGGTKAALESMTRTWSRELAGRATVNAINPGPVDTEMWDKAVQDAAFAASARPLISMTPLARGDGEEWSDAERAQYAEVGGRPGKRSEVAGIVGMLVSAESAWCTGSVVCANGGMRFTQ
jgi:NAD(P)-dependent dehydrogenase (short-subunit alcohol dehydrogenase family)